MADEERRLVDAAQRGDGESFNALVRLYESRVYNLIYRMLGDTESAADTTQDTFILAYRRLNTFRGGSFRSWLLRIATNASYDALRVRKRRQAVSIDALLGEDEEQAPFQLPDQQAGPEEQVGQKELATAIHQVLAQLPEDQRAVVVLSDIQGLAYDEIAVITDSNLGTVKSRLSRGRAKMRDLLRNGPSGELLPLRYRHETEQNKG